MLSDKDLKRIERHPNKRSGYDVYIYNCPTCNENEIRTEKARRLSHSGKCKQCARKRTPYKALYNRLKYSVNKRNIKGSKYKDFNITFEQFLEFTNILNCHYCNRSITWSPSCKKGVSQACNLDRKNSNLGYIKDNLVVCCQKCNYMKGSEFSYEEFKAIVNFLDKVRLEGFKHE